MHIPLLRISNPAGRLADYRLGKFFGETPSGILLVTCRFLAIFLVVSRKKRIFAAEVLNVEGIDYEKYE